jgi:hypothetical protein
MREVERTRDGKYVVMFMSFSHSPPPKGRTPEEALELFEEYYERKIKPTLPLPESDSIQEASDSNPQTPILGDSIENRTRSTT